MRAKTHQISWHFNRDTGSPMPVFGVDFQQHSKDVTGVSSPAAQSEESSVLSSYRMATCGADKTVKLWRVDALPESDSNVEFLAELKHQSSVNCVRFSPDGTLLASADDDGCVLIWQLDGEDTAGAGGATGNLDDDGVVNVENWRQIKRISAHRGDVYDIAWSPDGEHILTASVDNTAAIFAVSTGKMIQVLRDHKHYVQGVAWSPSGTNVLTQSSDRSCRLYRTAKKKRLQFVCDTILSKLPKDALNDPVQVSHAPNADGETVGSREKQQPQDQQGQQNQQDQQDQQQQQQQQQPAERLYVDEMRTNFVRRPCFSPDGALFATPAGRLNPTDNSDDDANTAFLFRASYPEKPILCINAADAVVVAVRFCPVFFELRHPGDSATGLLSGLDYRMVFAVVTMDSVLLYDTEQAAPFGIISNLHFASLSDVAWSSDARTLGLCSEDGYVSVVCFEEGELGVTRRPPSRLTAQEASTEQQDAAEPPAADAHQPPTSEKQSDDKTAAQTTAMPQPKPDTGKDDATKVVTKKPRRIVPQTIVAPAGNVSAAPSEPTAETSSATTKSAAASSSSAPARRIVPTLVGAQDKASTASSASSQQAEKRSGDDLEGKPKQRRIQTTLVQPAPSSAMSSATAVPMQRTNSETGLNYP